MMQSFLAELVRKSVTSPRAAARQVIGLGLTAQVLVMVLGLTVVVNSLLFFLSLAMAPPIAGLPAMFANPLVYAGVMGTGALAFVLLLTRIGVAMGGLGRVTDVLAVTVWLQCLRVLAQAAMLLVMKISPWIATMLTLAVTVFGLWLFISFVQEAHRFNGPIRALVTAGLSVLALLVGLVVVLMLTGVSPPQPI